MDDEPNSLAALSIQDDDDDEEEESILHPISFASTSELDDMMEEQSSSLPLSLAATSSPTCTDQTASEINQDALPYDATAEQEEMLLWSNYARTDPLGKIVPELEKRKAKFTGKDGLRYKNPGKCAYKTREGVKAVQELIDWYKGADRRVPALKWDQLLAQASKDMADA